MVEAMVNNIGTKNPDANHVPEGGQPAIRVATGKGDTINGLPLDAYQVTAWVLFFLSYFLELTIYVHY